jgi:hypothetical protein
MSQLTPAMEKNFQTSSFFELHVWTASKSSSTSLRSKVKILLSTGWPKHNCNPEIKLQSHSYVKKIIITSKQWRCLAWILFIVSCYGTSFSIGFIKFDFIPFTKVFFNPLNIPQSSIFVFKVADSNNWGMNKCMLMQKEKQFWFHAMLKFS